MSTPAPQAQQPNAARVFQGYSPEAFLHLNNLRDYFAGQVIAALYANPTTVAKAVANAKADGGGYKLVMARWAQEAYEQADAMLAHLKASGGAQ